MWIRASLGGKGLASLWKIAIHVNLILTRTSKPQDRKGTPITMARCRFTVHKTARTCKTKPNSPRLKQIIFPLFPPSLELSALKRLAKAGQKFKAGNSTNFPNPGSLGVSRELRNAG